ncbi:pilus assembly protein PilM [Rhodopirellula sp. JC740]|uniref:Pilus assembly protein PilM n=1 Tax=Rhodopirellula halodulae TaxID=2894198 RepID=A0ABS8NKR1_9BACT|nr:zinc ribbon domain-containing protein [Rhodopirellula sp. JC740]MCC9644148.1 pilus assembly protein PilM [Rhodopirellula sp. JC740]
MSVSSSTSASLACGACNHLNAAEAQFCGGCGHSLYEKCVQCGDPVSLSQKFCVGCGQDLSVWLKQRLTEQETKLTDAVTAAKEHEYERALAILNRLAQNNDYRFQSLRDQAAAAKEKVEVLQEKVHSKANQRIAAAKEAHAQNNLSAAVKLLAQVPENLLDDESKRIRQSSQVHLDQLRALQSELQQCLEEKNYSQVAGLLQQLLELEPENAKYQQLSQQVGDKLLRRANKLCSRQEYEAARNLLTSLPTICHNDQYDQLYRRSDMACWLSKQFDVEPFASNALGRLAMRYAKEFPSDGKAAECVKQLSQAVKSKRTTARDGLANWRGKNQSWLGGRVGVFANPQSLKLDELSERPSSFAPYAVAIGLALHALGRTRITGNLLPKKGVMSKLGFSKAKPAWGIDIGSSAIHAVKIRLDKGVDEPIVETVHQLEFKQPTCRGGSKTATELIPEAVTRLLEEINVDDTLVFANLPACDGVARFCELPPVKDKDADKLIETEVKTRIPIASDDLALLTWCAPLQKESVIGRPVVMSAATNLAVSRRTDLLGLAGLKLDGMVPESIALANFAAFEFSETLDLPEEKPAKKKKKGDEEEETVATNANQSITSPGKQPTLALVDIGASKTTLLLISPVSVWFWSYESGGEDATAIAARRCKITAEEAEQSKRNLAAIAKPHEVDEEIREKHEVIRARLRKLFEEADKTFRHLDIQEVWCVGSAHQQHGFIRRVLMK